MPTNEKSTMGERMANVEIVPSDTDLSDGADAGILSKWMVMALNGEITIEEAEKKEDEDLMRELGITAGDV